MLTLVETKISMVNGLTLVAKSGSNHWVMMDTVEELGGSSAAPTPFELFFMSFGGCQTMDILSILKKMKNKVERYELVIRAHKRDEHPRIAELIELEYRFWGELNEANVQRAIELSAEKYCSVSGMLKDEIIIKRSYRINPED